MVGRTQFLNGGEVYAIGSAELKAEFAPEMGGRMLSLRQVDGADILVPMNAHRFNILEWPRAGAYPLFPYHNRLAGAEVRVGNETVKLSAHPAALPHTLHGPSHSRPWRVTEHENDRLIMALDYAADADWPWAFTAVQEFHVEGSTLAITFSLTNNTTTQPESDAKFIWAHHDDYLPSGLRQAVIDRRAQELQPTSYLEGWTFARVASTADAVTTMSASPAFGYLVVHRGDPSHVCVEPVTHVANAWNIEADASAVGARLLQPGEKMNGTVRLVVSG